MPFCPHNHTSRHLRHATFRTDDYGVLTLQNNFDIKLEYHRLFRNQYIYKFHLRAETDTGRLSHAYQHYLYFYRRIDLDTPDLVGTLGEEGNHVVQDSPLVVGNRFEGDTLVQGGIPDVAGTPVAVDIRFVGGTPHAGVQDYNPVVEGILEVGALRGNHQAVLEPLVAAASGTPTYLVLGTPQIF